MDLDKILEGLPDDTEVDFGGEIGKFKAGELKGHVNGIKGRLAQTEQTLLTRTGEVQQLASANREMSALMGEAARQAGIETQQEQLRLQQQQRQRGEETDPFNQQYGSDPVLGAFARDYEPHLMRKVSETVIKPLFDKEVSPLLGRMQQENQLLQSLLYDERQAREYREAGEWPENMNFEAARKLGREKGYFVRNGEKAGYVDIPRLHGEVMGPILQQKREDGIRKETEEATARNLRMTGNVISMPARTGGVASKQVKVKGSSADSIIGGVLEQAAGDLETQRLLTGLRG